MYENDERQKENDNNAFHSASFVKKRYIFFNVNISFKLY